MDGASVLPYRTDAVALSEWLSARARGRSAEQLRSAVESPKAVEGTAAAAAALGFTDAVEGGLTSLGERFALAEVGERRVILKEAVLQFAPYGQMLHALDERGGASETEVRWVEAWWATRGYGSSESNRREGAAAFGRLIDFAGLGEYIPGRRGRPTRIRWVEGALRRDRANGQVGPGRTREVSAAASAPDLFTAAPPPPSPASATASVRRRSAGSVPASDSRAAAPAREELPVNRITVPLSGAAVARIEVPLSLPPAEKRRLLALLELLISEE